MQTLGQGVSVISSNSCTRVWNGAQIDAGRARRETETGADIVGRQIQSQSQKGDRNRNRDRARGTCTEPEPEGRQRQS